MKKISVVIVTYNSLHDIENCISSIHHQNDLLENEIEIIIVDNSSENVFNEMKQIISPQYRDIIFIHNPTNGGYGQGNNIGISVASSRIVCIANPDIILQQPMFRKTIDLFSNDKNLALVGGKQIGGMDMSFWIRPEYEFFLCTTPIMMILNKINLYLERFCFLSGALLFVDKEKFNQIGLFDDHIFLYREESDVTKRLLEKKFSTKFEKKFIYKHLIDDRTEVSDFSFREEINSTRYYLNKFNYSFDKFYAQRLFSYRILKCLYLITGKKNAYNKTVQILNRFKKIKTE